MPKPRELIKPERFSSHQLRQAIPEGSDASVNSRIWLPKSTRDMVSDPSFADNDVFGPSGYLEYILAEESLNSKL